MMDRKKLSNTGEMIMRNNIGGHHGPGRDDGRKFNGPNFINTFSSRMPTENELKQAQKSLSLLKEQLKGQPTNTFSYGAPSYNAPQPHYGAAGGTGYNDRRGQPLNKTDNAALSNMRMTEKVLMDQLNQLEVEQRKKDEMLRRNGYQPKEINARGGNRAPEADYYQSRNNKADAYGGGRRGQTDEPYGREEPQYGGGERRGMNRQHAPNIGGPSDTNTGGRQGEGRRNQSPITNNYDRMNRADTYGQQATTPTNYRNKFTFDDDHGFDDRSAQRGNKGPVRNDFDDNRPIGGARGQNMNEERGFGGMGGPAARDRGGQGADRGFGGGKYQDDERPIGGGNQAKGKGMNMDERPLGGGNNRGGFGMDDERPIGGGKKTGYGEEMDSRNQMQDMAQKNSRRTQQQPPQRRPPQGFQQEMEHDEDRPLKDQDANQAIKEAALADRNEELYECTAGCGRRFKQETLEKHVKICKKVFQTKRKVFDETAMRLENVVDPSQIRQIKKKVQQEVKETAAPTKASNKASWKAQSEAFRAHIKNAQGKEVTKAEAAAIAEVQNAGLVPCPSCGRTFGEKAAEKHIPNCQARNKASQMKSKQPPPKGGASKGLTNKR